MPPPYAGGRGFSARDAGGAYAQKGAVAVPQPAVQNAAEQPMRKYSGRVMTVSDNVVASAERLAEDEVIIRRRIEMATQHVRDKAAKRTAAQPTAKLYLRIPDRSRMEEAVRLVPKGAAIPVYVHIVSENATLLAPKEYWARLNPDITALIGALGDANVKLVKCQ